MFLTSPLLPSELNRAILKETMVDPEKTQLLELNLISAQNLKKLRRMQTYAFAWINPRNKLRTRIDTIGHENPTWNDKFIFTVPNWFISRENSAVEIEIYAAGLIKDTLVGTVRVLIGNLIDSGGATCTPLQVRRPSGRFHGVLNLGLMILDGSLKSLGVNNKAMGYRDLMGENVGRRFSCGRSEKSSEKSVLKVRNDIDNGGGKEESVISGKENTSDIDDDDDDDANLDLGSGGNLPLGLNTGKLCCMMFPKKNLIGGVSKIHLSPSDQNLQISHKNSA